MTETILVINAGSSSIKFQVFAIWKAAISNASSRGRSKASARTRALSQRIPKAPFVIDESWPAADVDRCSGRAR